MDGSLTSSPSLDSPNLATQSSAVHSGGKAPNSPTWATVYHPGKRECFPLSPGCAAANPKTQADMGQTRQPVYSNPGLGLHSKKNSDKHLEKDSVLLLLVWIINGSFRWSLWQSPLLLQKIYAKDNLCSRNRHTIAIPYVKYDLRKIQEQILSF